MRCPTLLLAFLAFLAGCAPYGKEIVLYDSTQKRGPRTTDDLKNPDALNEDQLDGLLAAEDGKSAEGGPAEGSGADPASAGTAAPDFRRLFALENLLGELDRALADGVGNAEALTQKRSDVAREIAWRKSEAGAAYDEARTARLRRLESFSVSVR